MSKGPAHSVVVAGRIVDAMEDSYVVVITVVVMMGAVIEWPWWRVMVA